MAVEAFFLPVFLGLALVALVFAAALWRVLVVVFLATDFLAAGFLAVGFLAVGFFLAGLFASALALGVVFESLAVCLRLFATFDDSLNDSEAVSAVVDLAWRFVTSRFFPLVCFWRSIQSKVCSGVLVFWHLWDSENLVL